MTDPDDLVKAAYRLAVGERRYPHDCPKCLGEGCLYCGYDGSWYAYLREQQLELESPGNRLMTD